MEREPIMYGNGLIFGSDSITVFEEEPESYFTGILDSNGQPIYFTYEKLKIGFDLT
jgi:hypothetical protein